MRQIRGTNPVTGDLNELLGFVYAGPHVHPRQDHRRCAEDQRPRDIDGHGEPGSYGSYSARTSSPKIEYLQISAGDSGEEGDTPATKRFFGTIEVHCQTQFSLPVALSLYNRVMAVNLDGIEYGTDESDLTPIPGS